MTSIFLGQDITWTNQPSNPTFGVRDENVTFEWDYRLNNGDELNLFVLKRRELSGMMKEIITYVASSNKTTTYNNKENKFVMTNHVIPSFMLINAQESDATKYCCTIFTSNGKMEESCVDLIILGESLYM